MASPMGHSMAGVIGYLLISHRLPGGHRAIRWLAGAVLLANLPDSDFLWPLLWGEPISNVMHRGGSHSLAFALLIGLLAGLAARRWRLPVLPVTVAATLLVASHLLLDMLGVDTRPPFGVPLFAPLSDRYFIAPMALFRGVEHTPLSALWSATNLWTACTDLLWMSPPLILTFWWVRRNQTPRALE